MERRDEADIGSDARGYPALRAKVDSILNRRRENQIEAAIDEAERLNAAGHGASVRTLPAADKVKAADKADRPAKQKPDSQKIRASSVPPELALVSDVKGDGKGKGKVKGECFEFAAGNCSYGKSCRFTHAAPTGESNVKGKGGGKAKAKGKAKGGAKGKSQSQPTSQQNSPRQTPPASPRGEA